MSFVEACLIAYYLITAGALLALWEAGAHKDRTASIGHMRQARISSLTERIAYLRSMRRLRRAPRAEA